MFYPSLLSYYNTFDKLFRLPRSLLVDGEHLKDCDDVVLLSSENLQICSFLEPKFISIHAIGKMKWFDKVTLDIFGSF